MKLHRGAPANPMTVETQTQGYWFKESDTSDVRFVGGPRVLTRRVRALYGVSIRGAFVGLMCFATPTVTYRGDK